MKLNMGEFPSGQRGQTVNLLSSTSVVRIHLLPPVLKIALNTAFRAVFFLLTVKVTAKYAIKYEIICKNNIVAQNTDFHLWWCHAEPWLGYFIVNCSEMVGQRRLDNINLSARIACRGTRLFLFKNFRIKTATYLSKNATCFY